MGYRLHIHGMGASKKVLEERICTVPRDSVLISGKFTHSVLTLMRRTPSPATHTLRKLPPEQISLCGEEQRSAVITRSELVKLNVFG